MARLIMLSAVILVVIVLSTFAQPPFGHHGAPHGGGYHGPPGVAVGYQPYRFLGYNQDYHRTYGVDGFGYKRAQPKLKQYGKGQYYGRPKTIPYGPSFRKVQPYPVPHHPAPYASLPHH